MAANPEYDIRDETLSGIQPLRRVQERKKGLQLSYRQLVVAWCLILTLMVVVFFFGVFAGRAQGFEEALAEQGQAAVRLPIEQPEATQVVLLSPAESTLVVEELIEPIEKITPKEAKSPPVKAKAAPPKGESAKKAAPVEPESPTAGFKSKPARVPAAPKKVAQREPPKSVKKTAVASVATAIDAKVAATPPAAAMRNKVDTTHVPVVNNLQKGWYIQVASRPNSKDSARLAQKYVTHGYRTQIEDTVVRGQRFYRVLIGPYSNKKTAESARKKLQQKKISSGNPYLKRVRG